MSYESSRLWTPSSGDFTADGSSTITNTRGGINISHSTNGDAHHLYGMYKTVPSAPYTLTTKMDFNGSAPEGNRAQWGIHLTDGTKYQSFELMTNVPWGSPTVNSFMMGVLNYDNNTTWNSNAAIMKAAWFSQDCWMQIVDDNTNRTYNISRDGVNFAKFYQTTRTTFLTPTRIGFSINPINSLMNATLTHWRVT